MDNFESLLAEFRSAVESYVRFRMTSAPDADDVLQEVYLSAFRNFTSLRDRERFKPWLIGIARSKCADWFRERARLCEIPLESIENRVCTRGLNGRAGRAESPVLDTLELLGDDDRRILYLYYFRELSQNEISRRLNIPLGTVKSRLHYAKKHFRDSYPCKPKGASMTKLPEILPEYTILKADKPPFSIRWEELMGWFIIPREGEKLSWAMYDFPAKRRTSYVDIEVAGRAEVHGIEGVGIRALEYAPSESDRTGANPVERSFIAQLTDTHCRFLAESHTDNGVRRYFTFLDGDAFLDNWGFGEDNCGNEVNLAPKGDITRDGAAYKTADKKFLLDVVGSYTVTICGKSYDTICIADCCTYNDGTFSEQYLDRNGRTVLWRRFNRDDWAKGRCGRLWSEMLPDNERVSVNGVTYVHWYDCITDYIL